MSNEQQGITELEFSEKYDENHARYYFEKHEQKFWPRLSNWHNHKAP